MLSRPGWDMWNIHWKKGLGVSLSTFWPSCCLTFQIHYYITDLKETNKRCINMKSCIWNLWFTAFAFHFPLKIKCFLYALINCSLFVQRVITVVLMFFLFFSFVWFIYLWKAKCLCAHWHFTEPAFPSKPKFFFPFFFHMKIIVLGPRAYWTIKPLPLPVKQFSFV